MSNIKINDVAQRIQYAATNGQTQFAIPFPFFDNAYVVVWQDGVQLFPGAAPGQYGLSGAGSPSGGLLTLVTAATLDSIITIQGEMPIDRTSIYSATISNLTGSDLNGDFNREVVMMKQIQTTQEFLQLQYAPWAEVSQDPTVTRDRFLPILLPQQVFRMNDAGTALEGYTIDTTPPSTQAPFVIYTADPTLETAQNLGLLGSGLLKQTVAAGVSTVAIAIPGVDYLAVGTPLGTMAFQDANNVNITGGFAALGAGSVATSPTASTDLVNKAYADSIAAGFQFKTSCVAASTVDLDAVYDNGALGVGATLIANNNGAIVVDGISLASVNRVLVKDQTNTFENGIYIVSTVGDGSTPFELTRATDFDTNVEIQPGAITFIQSGTVYNDTSFVQTEVVTTVGTDPVLFNQFSQQYPLSMGNGGTGSSITPIANAVFSSTAGSVGQLSTTLPTGLTIPGYATSGANSDITSLTGLTGKIQAPTAIASSAALNVLGFTYTGSAVNNLSVTNAITTASPILEALGTDTNVGIDYKAQLAGVHRFYSTSNAPFSFLSGTSSQHTTRFNFADTAQTRDITWPDADGTVALSSTQSMVLITTGTAANSASVDLTGMTGYTSYVIYWTKLIPATNGTTLLMRVSTNNGSSFISSAGAYAWMLVNGINNVLAATANQSDTSMTISLNYLNSGAVTGGGRIDIPNPANTNNTNIISHCNHMDSSLSLLRNTIVTGQYLATTTVNAVQFLMSSGNITTGTFYLYGIK